MMVKAENTIITNGAMGATWWTVQHASVTVLCLHWHPIHYHILGSW
jgi:hypothetical protein